MCNGIIHSAQAQDDPHPLKQAGKDVGHAAKETGKAVKHGAKKVGNEVAEQSSKGYSAVKDKIYSDKQGPNGETIYIDKHAKYYWVDEKGHKQYIAKSALRNK